MSETYRATSDQRRATAATAESFRPLSMAGAAFWPTMRKVALMAAGIDILFFLLFLHLEVPQLAWPNVSSILLYAMVYMLILRRANRLAMILMWVEVLLHATVGTIMLGWESGFHYYLLLFIPAIGIGSSVRVASILLPGVLACYLGLNALSLFVGPSNPLPQASQVVVRWFNIAVIFAMFSSAAIFYRRRVQNSQERLSYLATHDAVTGLWNRRQFMTMAEHEFARQRRTRATLTIVVIDVHAADSGGTPHARRVADRELVHAAHALKKNCRTDDIVARWDATEFLALLPCATLSEATLFAERVALAIEESLADTRAGSGCIVSTGLTEIQLGEDFFTALARADTAAEASKQTRMGAMNRHGSASHDEAAALFATSRN
jgi:diguanylate cyclase (GGDEF)-like protein